MNARVLGWIVGVALVTACRQRTAEVRTAPASQQQSQVAIRVDNNLNQAVNVYMSLSAGGQETFLRQVSANSSSTVPVQGFAAGSSVTLRAVTVDGVRAYQRQNVVLNGTFVFPLP